MSNDRVTEFDNSQNAAKAEQRKKWTISAAFVINAMLTFAYGFGVVLINFPPSQQESTGQRLTVYVAAVFCGLLMTVLFDVARYGWQETSKAPTTSKDQQSIARVMIYASFAGSIVASAIALQWLLAAAGFIEAGNAALNSTVFAWAIGIMTASHMTAAFAYKWNDPKEKAIRVKSVQEALLVDALSKRFEMRQEGAREQALERIDDGLPILIQGEQERMFGDGWLQLGGIADDAEIVPPPVRPMAASQPNHANGTLPKG